jgi:hypothetical protein
MPARLWESLLGTIRGPEELHLKEVGRLDDCLEVKSLEIGDATAPAAQNVAKKPKKSERIVKILRKSQ